MLRAVALLLIVSCPATAEVIDLRTPQSDGFRSVVDLRGLADVPPQAATPAARAAPVQIAAPMPATPDAQPQASHAHASHAQASQTQPKPARVVYVGYGMHSDAERPAKPRRSLRFGRRR